MMPVKAFINDSTNIKYDHITNEHDEHFAARDGLVGGSNIHAASGPKSMTQSALTLSHKIPLCTK